VPQPWGLLLGAQLVLGLVAVVELVDLEDLELVELVLVVIFWQLEILFRRQC
jgi:hypothetical protein